MASHERLEAFGNQLIDVHLRLREEPAALRADVDAYLSDGASPRELRPHCLTFCSALNRQHRGENGTAFGVIAAQLPEPAPGTEELRGDHRLVEDSLRRLETLVAAPDRCRGTGEAGGPDAVRREVDSTAALMETHFVYEEKRTVSALNALDVPAWRDDRPAFLRTDTPES
ncbi:hemerythrin domain-containing protein [Streptomyces sp. NPDC006134]|uniref:hemerythrin domain-containing protein n=1 Tax=Streptomyces sp. NPDC006134 TaxID=3154467 RepID=UPI0034015041